jgi:hypothetical protein
MPFGRFGGARRPKYRAVHVFVTSDGTFFERAALEALATHHDKPTRLVVHHKSGVTEEKPMPMVDLAKSVGLTGVVFASKREASRWITLRREEADGAIRDLRRQVKYDLHVNGATIGAYIADYVYIRDGQVVVEDVKGMRGLETYQWKRKHLKAEHGITITEVR